MADDTRVRTQPRTAPAAPPPQKAPQKQSAEPQQVEDATTGEGDAQLDVKTESNAKEPHVEHVTRTPERDAAKGDDAAMKASANTDERLDTSRQDR